MTYLVRFVGIVLLCAVLVDLIGKVLSRRLWGLANEIHVTPRDAKPRLFIDDADRAIRHRLRFGSLLAVFVVSVHLGQSRRN